MTNVLQTDPCGNNSSAQLTLLSPAVRNVDGQKRHDVGFKQVSLSAQLLPNRQSIKPGKSGRLWQQMAVLSGNSRSNSPSPRRGVCSRICKRSTVGNLTIAGFRFKFVGFMRRLSRWSLARVALAGRSRLDLPSIKPRKTRQNPAAFRNVQQHLN